MEPFTPRAGDQLGTEQGESSNSQQQETQQTTTISFEGQQNNEEREISPTSGSGSPVSAHNESEQDALDRELQELEAWREKTAKRQRVAQLREAQARYLAGDQTALQTVINGATSHNPGLSVPTAKLPTPKAPHTFAKRTRLEYNCWMRDCERYFTMIPASFAQEFAKVDFGAQYISETMKSLWQAHCADQKRTSPLWQPTWEALKAVMLGSLGTVSERRQRAYETLGRAKMLPSQTPTELLDYMRPYWEELGSTHGPEVQMMGFVNALPEDIKKQLFMYPEDRRRTITEVEEISNLIHRQSGRKNPSKDGRAEKTKEGVAETQKGEETRDRGQKRKKEPGKGHFGPKRGKTYHGSRPNSSPNACFRCGKEGHFKSECPSYKGKKPEERSESGKAEGRKE